MRELIHQLCLQLKTLDAYIVELEKENKELKGSKASKDWEVTCYFEGGVKITPIPYDPASDKIVEKYYKDKDK